MADNKVLSTLGYFIVGYLEKWPVRFVNLLLVIITPLFNHFLGDFFFIADRGVTTCSAPGTVTATGTTISGTV